MTPGHRAVIVQDPGGEADYHFNTIGKLSGKCHRFVVCSAQMDPSPDDHDRFLRLYAAHEPSLHGFVRALVPTRDDAREVMQEVAVALWRKFASLEQTDDFRRWAFGVARMQVMAWRRDSGRERLRFGDEALAAVARRLEEKSGQLESQREALEECLGKLPPSHRQLIRSAYAPGVRIDELAARQGRSAMSVYKLLHRIRMALIECTRAVLAREGVT